MTLAPKFPSFRLDNGRSIRMESIYRVNTYDRLVAGSPDRLTNFSVIERLSRVAERMTHTGPGRSNPVILPTRVFTLPWSRWEEVAWYRFSTYPRRPRRAPDRLRPEWMPTFASAALFTSEPVSRGDGDYSVLSVLWFQERFESLIEDEPLIELLKISWDVTAKDFRF